MGARKKDLKLKEIFEVRQEARFHSSLRRKDFEKYRTTTKI